MNKPTKLKLWLGTVQYPPTGETHARVETPRLKIGVAQFVDRAERV